MAQTMSMGQAAGFAAVQSLQRDESASDVSVSALQQTLQEQGALLETPDRVAVTGRNGWRNNIKS